MRKLLSRLWEVWEREPYPCLITAQTLFLGVPMLAHINQRFTFIIYNACRHPAPGLNISLYIWGMAFVVCGMVMGVGLYLRKRMAVTAACILGFFLWWFCGFSILKETYHVGTGYSVMFTALVFADVARRLYGRSSPPPALVLTPDTAHTTETNEKLAS
jgi:hypothetical protein